MVAVEEQHRVEIDFRRSVTRHEALRTIATGGVFGAVFVFWLAVVLAPAYVWAPGAVLALVVVLAVREWRTVGRLRAEAAPRPGRG